MLEQIRTEHDLDYIMITGDYPAHDVWLQSRWAQTLFPIYLQVVFREHNLATAGFVLESLTEVFPDTQVVPSLGNHEPFPCNMWEIYLMPELLTWHVPVVASRAAPQGWRVTSSPQTGCCQSSQSISPPGCPGPSWRASVRQGQAVLGLGSLIYWQLYFKLLSVYSEKTLPTLEICPA